MTVKFTVVLFQSNSHFIPEQIQGNVNWSIMFVMRVKPAAGKISCSSGTSFTMTITLRESETNYLFTDEQMMVKVKKTSRMEVAGHKKPPPKTGGGLQ